MFTCFQFESFAVRDIFNSENLKTGGTKTIFAEWSRCCMCEVLCFTKITDQVEVTG